MCHSGSDHTRCRRNFQSTNSIQSFANKVEYANLNKDFFENFEKTNIVQVWYVQFSKLDTLPSGIGSRDFNYSVGIPCVSLFHKQEQRSKEHNQLILLNKLFRLHKIRSIKQEANICVKV